MATMTTASQKAVGIGSWTANAAHDTGFRVYDPALDAEYMYVKWDNGAGNLANGIDGTPCGPRHHNFNASATGTGNAHCEMIVTTDVSDSTRLLGVVRNSSNTSPTDGYYGWIELFRPGAKIRNARLVTASAASDIVAWAADDHLASTTFASVLPQYVARLAIVLSGVTSTTAGTTNYVGDVLCL